MKPDPKDPDLDALFAELEGSNRVVAACAIVAILGMLIILGYIIFTLCTAS